MPRELNEVDPMMFAAPCIYRSSDDTPLINPQTGDLHGDYHAPQFVNFDDAKAVEEWSHDLKANNENA